MREPIVNTIPNSKSLNKEILSLIEKTDKEKFISEKENITYTDWKSTNKKRPYFDLLMKYIKPVLGVIADKLHSYNWNVDHYWFQQYYKNDFHDWHTHINCQFNNIYYVELPNKELTTEIYNHKPLNLKEGDLVSFPSFWYHRSPRNETNERKTIISFSSNFQTFKGT